MVKIASADHGETTDALRAVDVAKLTRGRDGGALRGDVLADLLEPRVPLLGRVHVERLVLGLAVGEHVTGHVCLLVLAPRGTGLGLQSMQTQGRSKTGRSQAVKLSVGSSGRPPPSSRRAWCQ